MANRKISRDEQEVNYHITVGKWLAIYDHLKNSPDLRKGIDTIIEIYEHKKNRKPED